MRYQALIDNEAEAKSALEDYVARLRNISPLNRPELFPTGADHLAYWLNAYNALAMQTVLQKRLPANVLLAGTYTAPLKVGGTSTTLERIESRHIRPAGDPRVHFAVNPMTKSAAPLSRVAYSGAELDDQLDAQGRRFLSDPRAVRPGPDAATVRLSELFTRFYPGDFRDALARATGRAEPDLLEALRPFADAESPLGTAARYQTMPYDWSINRAD